MKLNITQWFKDQYNKIVTSNDQKYLSQIKDLQHIQEELQDQVNVLNDNIAQNNIFINKLQLKLDAKNLQLDLIQKEEKIYPKPDLDVDWDRFPYFPASKIYYYNKEDNKVNEFAVQWTPSKLTRVWTDEMYNYVIKAHNKYKEDTEKVRIIFLRDLVFSKCKYQTDFNQSGLTIENWKTPVETYYSGFGDCEDLTNLWLTFCNIVGIPSDKVFNLTGYYNTTGHSFGGYLDDMGKMWIIECTSKASPILMKGSVYKCSGKLSGITNWSVSGIPKASQF